MNGWNNTARWTQEDLFRFLDIQGDVPLTHKRSLLIVEASDANYTAFLCALAHLPEDKQEHLGQGAPACRDCSGCRDSMGRLGCLEYREYPVPRCTSGEECLAYLRHEGKYARPRPPRPSLILLDLDLPGMHATELLRQLKADPGLRGIPVIVFTDSEDESDISRCYRSGANSFITRPQDPLQLDSVVKLLLHYWFRIVHLPA